METKHVLAWLENLESTSPPCSLIPNSINTISRKRPYPGKPIDQNVLVLGLHRLPTPGSSTILTSPSPSAHGGSAVGDMSSPSKRPRLDDAPDHELSPFDPTPRATRTRDIYSRDDDESSASTSHTRRSQSSKGLSFASHGSSPTKQYLNAEMQDTGFQMASFAVDAHRLPRSLQTLHQQLMKISYGEGILPSSMENDLLDCNLPKFAFRQQAADASLSRSMYPHKDSVKSLLRRAAECMIEHEGESSWNMEIHRPLLDWVFRSAQTQELLEYRYCTSAQVIREFKPKNAPSKMIDFCLAIRPELGSAEHQAIYKLRKYRPGYTINHTDWGNLRRHPIAISIETKRQGEHWDKSMLQIGTWHASQLRSLTWQREKPLQALEFVSGIVIQGHDWHFVASFLEEDRAVLFNSLRLGDTESEFGAYKLLASLRCLKLWAEDTYWPSFKKDILGL